MKVNRFIYWHKEDKKSVPIVHLIVGYNKGSIQDFQEMADELRKTFPQATNDQITSAIINRNGRYLGRSIIQWTGKIPPGDYPGFHQIDEGEPEYGW